MAGQYGRAPAATFIPGGLDDDYYMPPAQPALVAPEPQRINPDMSNQIAGGLQNMGLNSPGLPSPTYGRGSLDASPHLSPIPKVVNRHPNVPPSDEELEDTLENARDMVLNSNDPEMQLAWAADALIYVGVCADDEERRVAARPGTAARPATPRVEHQLKVDAMNIVEFLAGQDHPKARFLKGMWLEWGRYGQREDKKEAFKCYMKAADKNYTRALYRLGMLYESYNDPVKALKQYNLGVDAGDAACCYRLGMMTLRGQHGQQQDYARALDRLRRSANAADENAAQGAYVYGMLLARQLPQIDIPEGYLPYDEAEAKSNIEKAAFLKFAKAQLKMASMYELGSFGCPFDPVLSIHYNALASKQGEAEADMALSKWFLVGHEGAFPKNEALAYSYAERAAVSGLATAEFALGYFNEIGVSVPSNLDKAMEWYQKAASHGNSDAQGRIDGINKKQVLNKRDHENVAITRIKSQHGSMRGARPLRLQNVGNRPPTIQESDFSTPPARGTTPYPVDNDPPRIAALPRPATVAPYPTHDGASLAPDFGRPPPVGGFFAAQDPSLRPHGAVQPELRPSSAFQVAPDLRPTSMNGSVPPHPANGPVHAPGRPLAQSPAYGYGGPRPGMGHDPNTRPPPQRIVSGPPTMLAPPRQQGHRIVSTPSNMQPQPGPPRPGQMHHSSTTPVSLNSRLDIGYSAPPDSRPSSQRPPNVRPQPQNFAQPPQSRPPRATSPAVPPKPPAKTNPVSSETSAGGGAKPLSSSGGDGGGNKPPGKGPKTFEEMGVPSGKQDSDCVIM